ncbi:hypothetical protein L9F63_003388 [Diploptera punctata]|uniref:Glomulin n=1 Tax=Diploptera punctata TaxID=6984 RepID=A0AAD7ZK76_DIPPU|nr:hypothetical protein L9F63_003388 [Diploptera punctata]
MSMDLCNELITLLNSHISENNISDALSIINSSKYENYIKDRSWDLIPAISKHLEEIEDNSLDTFHCCQSLLEEIAHKANAEEALLEFLEEAESVENDIKFLALLKPLEIVLFRLPKRRGHSLEWCLSMIQTHVSSLPYPENYKLEGSERKLMDSDPSVVRINNVYEGVVNFYEPFIKELSCKKVLQDCRTEIQKDVLVSYIFRMLERPIAVLDLYHDGKSCSSVTYVIEKLLSFIVDIVCDPMVFLQYTEVRENLEEKDKKSTMSEENGSDIFNSEEKLPNLSVAVFYYLILSEKLCINKIPHIYSPVYLYQRCLFLVVILLENVEELLIHKGLLFAKEILSQISDGSLNYLLLDSPVNVKFVKSLTKVMVYCEVEEMRKSAILIFQSYLRKFDVKGQYLLMSNLPKVINHSGILGYLIMQLKDMIVNTFNDRLTLFSGKRLYDLIKKYCYLEHGAESDLVENADQIVSSLNLIRFLILRDKENKTGIWDRIGNIQISFLDCLREGIKLSRAHYELKLKDLKEEIRSGKIRNGENSEVNIIVGGQVLPNLPHENKEAVIYSALNVFDLMESLLSRINECIESQYC